MYVDGTSALQMLDQVFDVIEGGGSVPAGEVVEFVADNGTKIADVTTHTVNAANGAAAEVGEVVDIAAGATAGTATGAGIFTIELGAAGAAIAPALGVLAGVGLYNLAPEFWTNVSNTLVEAGKTVKGKIVGFIDKNGVTSFDEDTIEIFKNAFLQAGLFQVHEDVDVGEISILDDYVYSPLVLNPLSSGYVHNTSSQYYQYFNFNIAGPNVKSCIFVVRLNEEQYRGVFLITASQSPYAIGIEVFSEARVPEATIQVNLPETVHGESIYCSISSGNIGVLSISDIDSMCPYNIMKTQPIPENAWKEIAYQMLYGDITQESVIQPGATVPTEDPFPLTYPTWTPYEFPEPLPASMPDVYPVALPTPSITQDPSQEGANETAPQQDSLVNLLYDNAPSNVPDVTPDTDPYSPPASEPTPPEPTPDPDPIDPNPSPTPSGTTIPLPTLDTTRASKMFTVYNPTDAQVDALGGFLWTNSIIEQIKKMWQNPLDGIISFHKVYCSPTTGSSKNIVLGYIDSGVSALEVTSQFADVDCGTIHIPERLHNATDYSPFTALHCYLPFIGMVELDTDECMNADLHIKYRIDVYTGTCVALLYLKRNVDMPNEQIVYTFSGNASQKLPLTAADFSGAVGALLGLAGAGVAVASGGSLGVAAGALGAAHSLTSEMVHIQHSGGLSANAGILSPRVPYIILSRQYGYDANAYNSFYGYPANKTVYIGNCNGFIKCKEVLFVGSCTEEEIAEIHAILKEGVYV